MTNETKQAAHTPGPWAVDDPIDKNPQRGKGGERVHKVVASGLVADVSAWWYDVETARANATLIAAAPDLLDALRDMLADAETLKEPFRNEAICESARAAIAKAEGR